MAKMFYTMDETKAALNRSEDEIRQLTKDGKLREFRDGPRLMYKADQVEALKSELAGGGGTEDQIGLGAGDTHTPLGLMDSKTGSGSGAALKLDTATGTPSPKEDTGAGMDVGLSGSLSGSIGGGSLAGGTLGGTSARGTGKPGVNVFGDEAGDVDPMAQTHMSPTKDQISLEGVGSGSGLLDLTRETDDTSLGAALLDEISPGGKRTGQASASSGSTAGMTSISPLELPPEPVGGEVGGGVVVGAPITVEAPDPVAPAFGAASIAASIMVVVSALVMIRTLVVESPLIDTRVDMLKGDNAAYIFLGVGLLLAIILFVIGVLTGKRSGAAA